MCMQCMGTAVVAVSSASGIRAYLAARRPGWVTPGRLKFASAMLMALAVFGSGISVG